MLPLIQSSVSLLGIAFVTLFISMLVITASAVIMRAIGIASVPVID